ncbi:Beta-glucosidase cel3A [Castilleja foliolosa]|uniref:Endoglucanase n=1 Tax=Castilleja foliolosa TaxID=1961234 RepID=A0ABD3DI33_9LAMI
MMDFSNVSQYFLHSIFILLLFCFTFAKSGGNYNHDYNDALEKSILFFQGQRSGKLPSNTQQIKWRGNSALSDGKLSGVDLTGGYYDAGDNVKFNLPMAFTTTMLSWSVVEFGMKSNELNNAREAIRWGTDYLLKCALATPGKLYAGVGDANKDHACWERPEDMDSTDRSVYSVSASNPGSDVAAETAAALAAASIVFRKVDPRYRYKDELLWGAAWLFRATNMVKYYNIIKSLGADDDTDTFSWDNKYAGARVLLSRQYLVNKDSYFQQFSEKTEHFMCKVLPNSPQLSGIQYTRGGLMHKNIEGSNMQYVTAITFLITTYAKYSATQKRNLNCGGHIYTPSNLRAVAKSQVDYILGDNPMKMSYMVGYGTNYPKRIHHRGSSLPSINAHKQKFGCHDGQSYYSTSSPNPNILTGAVVGGPDINDGYADDRSSYSESEPATYINAPLVGILAYFAR